MESEQKKKFVVFPGFAESKRRCISMDISIIFISHFKYLMKTKIEKEVKKIEKHLSVNLKSSTFLEFLPQLLKHFEGCSKAQINK